VKLAVAASLLLGLGLAVPAAVFFERGQDSSAEPFAGRLGPRPFVALDSSGNGHDGIIQGTPHVGLPGRSGTRAYAFGSPGSWIQVPSSEELNPGARDFLVSAWVNLDHVPTTAHSYDLMRKGVTYTVGGDYKLEIVTGGAVRCTVTDRSGVAGVATFMGPDLLDGHWHHVGCARTGSTVSVIIGDLVHTHEVVLGGVRNTMAVSLGSKYGWEDRTRGRLDDVSLQISSNPPRPHRLVDVEQALEELRSEEPVASWHFDERPSMTMDAGERPPVNEPQR
jgi:hypothetical protein